MRHVRVLVRGRCDLPPAAKSTPSNQSEHADLVDELRRRLSRYSPEAREWLKGLLKESSDNFKPSAESQRGRTD